MEFTLLGSLSVSGVDGPVEVRGYRIRVLLGLLLLNANQAVPSSTLLAEAWDRRAPQDGGNALEAQIKRLRMKLAEWEPDGPGRRRLTTQYRGYMLAVGEGELDAERFQVARAEGRALLGTDPQTAADVLREALRLWRGSALQDLDSPTCEAAAVRLEQSRMSVREDLIHAELRLGRHREILEELHELVLVHPLHESYYDYLMVALCRSGFVGDAINTYRKARSRFITELGIEPSPLLRRRMEMILHNDAAVLAVGRAAS